MKTKEYGVLVKEDVYDPETLKVSRNSENLFTRQSLLSFATIMLLLLDMQKTALQARGNNFFEFSLAEIIELYALRWKIETMFRVLKEHLFIESFSGKTVNSIFQDFYATMVILIGVAIFQKEGNIIVKAVRKHKNDKHEHEVNISNIVSTMRYRFIFTVLFHPDEAHVEREVIDITYKIAEAIIPKIKNRHFPRKPKPHYKAKHNLKVRS